MSICRNLLNILYPPKCIFCGDIISEYEPERTCCYCRNDLVAFSSPNAVFLYSSIVRRCIHNFKYNYHPEYSIHIAGYMYTHLLENDMTDFDLIIPIPMYHRKKKKRGFNQAELLAADLSRFLSIPINTDALLRIRNTRPQSKVDFSARFDNLKHAFSVAKSDEIKNKRILLVDDIYTSGSTIHSCTALLLKNGAAAVSYITFAAANIKGSS